jgi:hypothetical protein
VLPLEGSAAVQQKYRKSQGPKLLKRFAPVEKVLKLVSLSALRRLSEHAPWLRRRWL